MGVYQELQAFQIRLSLCSDYWSVTEAHFDLFIFAPLYSKGRHTPSQELKVALFGALLRQDLEYLEQCPLDTGVCGNILNHFKSEKPQISVGIFFGGMMLLIFLVLSHDFLGTAKPSHLSAPPR
jgi:hypothetical protein